MHFEKMWDSKWNMRDLLSHIVDILLKPDLALLPEKMMYILNLWLKSQGRQEIHPDPSPLLFSAKVDNLLSSLLLLLFSFSFAPFTFITTRK